MSKKIPDLDVAAYLEEQKLADRRDQQREKRADKEIRRKVSDELKKPRRKRRRTADA